MITQMKPDRRGLPLALAITALLILAPGALAQDTPAAVASGTPAAGNDWSAWRGCWEPADARTPATAAPAARDQLVCVLPVAGEAAVEIATIADDRLVERVRVEASGKRQERTEEGCSGWESAEWSADGRRIYLHSEYSCPGGLQRRSSGVLAIAPGSQWLDVQGVTVGDQTATRTLRYRPVHPAVELVNLPAEIVAVLAEGRTLAARTARLAAAPPLTIEAVIDAAQHLDAPVAQAWLVEQAQGFALDVSRLLELEAAGVPSGVIDLMVALSYPQVFAIDRTPHASEFSVAEAPRTATPGAVPPANANDRSWDPFGYYGAGYYGFGSGFYSPYRYGSFGYGAYGSGWYPGNMPVIIVVRDSARQENTVRQRGRVVNGRGYTRDSAGSGNPQAGRSPSERVPTGSAAPSSQSGSGASSPAITPAGATSGSSSGSTRTARPRDPDRSGNQRN
jgi:hypothetical protein